jgi:hypothetical protein
MIFKQTQAYQIQGKHSPKEVSENIADVLKNTYKTEVKQGAKGWVTNLGAKLAIPNQWYLYVDKNNFHGLELRAFEKEGNTYLMVSDFIPSTVLSFLWRNTGILLRPLFSMFFGKKDDLEQALEEAIKSKYTLIEQ